MSGRGGWLFVQTHLFRPFSVLIPALVSFPKPNHLPCEPKTPIMQSCYYIIASSIPSRYEWFKTSIHVHVLGVKMCSSRAGTCVCMVCRNVHCQHLNGDWVVKSTLLSRLPSLQNTYQTQKQQQHYIHINNDNPNIPQQSPQHFRLQ